MRTLLQGLAVSLAVLVWALPAQAGVIIGPVAVTAPSENGSAVAANMVNQSGLSAGYTSQVTDFDTYVASTLHRNGGATVWANEPPPVFPTNLDFDLGGAFSIESIALWNWNGNQAVRGFNLFAADDNTFAGATLLGSFSASISGLLNVSAQVFSFAPTTASFVRLEVLSNHGGNRQIVLSEVIFEQAATVPAPATLALLGLGLLAVFARRRA